jgi:PAS domain S-box-containing protein
MAEGEHYLKKELYDLVRTSPEIFEFLQAGSLDGIWYWDIQDPEHEWLSQRFKEVFGYEVDEVPHTSAWWQENIFPEDLPKVLDNFNKHCADPNHLYDQIVRYRHKDGSTVWVRCRGLAIRDADGKPLRMLGAHSDVTQLMRIEEELKRKVAELERINEIMVDRELKMVEFKNEIKALKARLK